MAKAVIYRRVSDQEQRLGYSLDGYQTNDTHAYCAEKGYEVVAELEEVHTAHDTLDTRPVLQQLRSLINSKAIDVVVVWRFDRLARGYLDDAVLTREAQQAEVRIESATEKLPDGPLAWAIRAIIGAQAEQEWHDIRQRAMAGVRQRVERGLYLPGNRPPYGYSWADKKKSRLVINPKTSTVVKCIFDLACAGLSGHAIARHLSQERIPSPTGKSYWRFDVVCDLINNPLYTGKAVAFRTRQPIKCVINPVTGKVERKRSVLPGESIPLPDGVVPPLVTTEKAELALAYLARHRTSPLPGKVIDEEAYLLRGGLAECGVCGKSLTVRTRGPTPTTQPIYRCVPTYDGKPELQRHTVGITTRQLDDHVWAAFVEAVSKPEIVSAALAGLEERRVAEVASQLKIRQDLLDENLEQQEHLVDTLKLLKQNAVKERIAQQLNTLAAQESQIRTSIAALEQQGTVFASAQAILHKFATLRETADLKELGFHEKRHLLFDFGVHVKVFPVGRGVYKDPSKRCHITIDVLAHTSRANMVAMPWPTPMHIVASP